LPNLLKQQSATNPDKCERQSLTGDMGDIGTGFNIGVHHNFGSKRESSSVMAEAIIQLMEILSAWQSALRNVH
jgi:hypothetical protein